MIYFGKYQILETKITACDYDYVLDKIFKNLNKKIIFAPVASHPLVLANNDNEYRKILSNIDFVLPDSFYVKWSLDFLYKVKIPSRIYGPDLFLKILKKAEKNKIEIILIGNYLDKLEKKIKEKYSNLKIKKKIDVTGKILNHQMVSQINNNLQTISKAVILIGIGSPNQHYLACDLKVNCPVVCVGAAFDFVSGVKKQAPRWMGEWGLEWSWRLINEAGLLKRYLCYGIFFIFLLIKQKLWIKE